MTEKMEQLGFKEVDPTGVDLNPFDAVGNRWMLITAGDESGSNTMTASWGGFGVIWGRNVVAAVIRPQRYTKQFVDAGELFTLSFYPDDKKRALAFCGANSGRDMAKDEKAKTAGLTALYLDGTTAYEEANLIFVCKKLYQSDITPDAFLDKSLDGENYPNKDYHTAYIAEVVKAYKK